MTILLFRPIVAVYKNQKCVLHPFESSDDRDFLLGVFEYAECIQIQGLDCTKIEAKLPVVIPNDATVFLHHDIVQQDGSLSPRPNPEQVEWTTAVEAGDYVEFRSRGDAEGEKSVSSLVGREAEGGSSRIQTKQPKQSEILDDDEANFLIKKFLKNSPKATIREVASEVGLSTGKVSGLESWKYHMAERRAAKPPSKVKERPLTKKMLQSIGMEDNPAEKVLRADTIWDSLLRITDRKKREELLKMPESKRIELIQVVLEQFRDEPPPDLWDLE